MKINCIGRFFCQKKSVETNDQIVTRLVNKGITKGLDKREFLDVTKNFAGCSDPTKMHFLNNLLDIGKNSRLHLDNTIKKLTNDNDPSNLREIYDPLIESAYIGETKRFKRMLSELKHKYSEGAIEPPVTPVKTYDRTEGYRMEELIRNEIINRNDELSEGISDNDPLELNIS